MDLLEELKEEDTACLNEECQSLIKLLGLETFKKVVREHDGRAIYIPKRKSIVVGYRNKKIVSEFNGNNYRELAGKYGLTEMWIRNIVNGLV